MKIPERQLEARKNIFAIETAIQDAIDDYCEGKGVGEYGNVSYAEINAALQRVLNTYNGQELKELWNDEQE